MIQTRAISQTRRSRMSTQPFVQLPPLSEAQLAVLRRWLRSDTQERTWQVLLQAAGQACLDVAEPLLQVLLTAGAVRLKEEFQHGQWRPWRMAWCDLCGLQRALGFTSAAERQAVHQDVLQGVHLLEAQKPALAPAVQSCLKTTLAKSVQQSRAELLLALAQWLDEQRHGLRQDFALAARGHTKSITATEWDWLQTCLPLEAMGIARFEPLLWLCGALVLQKQDFELDLRGTGFIGLPSREFCPPLTVTKAPCAYWLIENRASFERQTRKLNTDRFTTDVCLIWLPGRPGRDWLQAVGWLLAQAPAPGTISCDPDPAGIQIALTAGRLWEQAGLHWQGGHMAPDYWATGTTLPLTDYDRRVLAELQADAGLCDAFKVLTNYIHDSGRKAEQEGWL